MSPLGDGRPSLALQFDSGSEEVPGQMPESGHGGNCGPLGAFHDRAAVQARAPEARGQEGDALRQVWPRHGHQV